MEDGAVSIFGLVFGVAQAAETSADVLLAGATGAAAAAVSMMAGGSGWTRAANRTATAPRPAATPPWRCRTPRGARRPGAAVAGHDRDRRSVPIPPPPARGRRGLAVALRGGGGAAARSPAAHALWMFATDLFAGAVPVLPFAFLPIAEARWVSIAITAVLLVALGIGRGLWPSAACYVRWSRRSASRPRGVRRVAHRPAVTRLV